MSPDQVETDGRGSRREWADAATDYVLERGLIGLTLRPLAAALGTSDRMLIYRFGSKDSLVAEVLRTSNARATEYLSHLPPSEGPKAAVRDLWAAVSHPAVDGCHRLYVEAAALRLFGQEPYASIVRETNNEWRSTVVDHLTRSGLDAPAARRISTLIDAAFVGLRLDLPLGDSNGTHDVDTAVADLATAVSLLAESPVGRQAAQPPGPASCWP
ncbi:TetR/AcrR family transcriptional regulator [Nocardioides eburneiflavus]|uniref:TetR/AcrR family transcriptional regulator n=1 Tax=Nocardioides eburneiflavus TaxID=2518372 RepID=A0A4Z1CIF6_9ACTN|nr:TetR/AcrR family transcriptional regulator [Nocardioides eburneiflavus]TGN65727.1 TetR/AcrR family transcriptional regulator [Nocardioides eburneiflavus]